METIRDTCASVLNIPNDDSWDVTEVYDNLVMISSNDKGKVSYIDGTIIDIKSKELLNKASTYSPKCIQNSITGQNGKILINDEYGTLHNIDINQAIATPLFDGVMLRVYWYNSELRISTNSRINTDKSRWGNSSIFADTFRTIGPKAEELFDTSASRNTTVYYFLLVEPALLMASKQKVTEPYLLYIEYIDFDSDRAVPGLGDNATFYRQSLHYLDMLDMSKHENSIFECDSHESPKDMTFKCHVFECQSMTLDEINDYLTKGHAVTIVYPFNEDLRSIKVISESHNNRRIMRNENPNVMQQYYILQDKAITEEEKYSIYLAYKDSLPPHIDFDYNTVLNDRRELAEWINKYKSSQEFRLQYNIDAIPPRVIKLCSMKKSIDDLLWEERGISLYSMIRDINMLKEGKEKELLARRNKQTKRKTRNFK